MYRFIFKRTFDIIFSFILLIITIPIMLFSIFTLALVNRGKVFFIQSRPGKENKIFNIIKFKTMNDKCNEFGDLLPDHLRLTKVGRLIRKLSIDELPQLLNVIKGDMSLIGPRPLLVEYLPLYNSSQIRRHEVRPGITGWAQVNGRNSITWEDKFQMDVWYVQNLTFWLDLKIFFMSILKILKREGINSTENTTMPIFKGEQ